jgi:hypothetical protein
MRLLKRLNNVEILTRAVNRSDPLWQDGNHQVDAFGERNATARILAKFRNDVTFGEGTPTQYGHPWG